jgi:hypothetical protein
MVQGFKGAGHDVLLPQLLTESHLARRTFGSMFRQIWELPVPAS